jgi:hypothetical protein
MFWIIERILERLLLKSALQMGSRKEAEMELVQVESRAELLRRAKELEEEKVPGFEQLAVTLRKKAAEMEAGGVAPGADVLKVAEELRGDDLQNGHGQKATWLSAPQKEQQTALPAPRGKKRGRPRKHPLPDLTGQETVES